MKYPLGTEEREIKSGPGVHVDGQGAAPLEVHGVPEALEPGGVGLGSEAMELLVECGALRRVLNEVGDLRE